MIDAFARRQFRALRRRGLSILEFFGCLTAMLGGVLLGSFYLGVDVKEMTYSALEQAQIVDPRAKAEEDDEAPASEPSAATAEPATPANQIPDSSSQDPAAEPTPKAPAEPDAAPVVAPAVAEPVAVPPPPAAGFFSRPEHLTDQQRKTLTLQYWEAIGACMTNETKGRTAAIDKDGNWQLFDYLTGRKEGHLRAAADVAALDVRGVDNHVLAYAEKAQAWHEDGARLFGRAVDLLTDAPTAQLSGPFAQSWQSASTQHRMEERLLGEKHDAVQKYLDHAYESAPAAAQP